MRKSTSSSPIGSDILTREGQCRVLNQEVLTEQLLVETEDHRVAWSMPQRFFPSFAAARIEVADEEDEDQKTPIAITKAAQVETRLPRIKKRKLETAWHACAPKERGPRPPKAEGNDEPNPS